MPIGPPPDWVPPRLTCLLAGTGRTGSTHLGYLMKNTGQLGWPREFFNPDIAARNITLGVADLPDPPGGDVRSAPWRCELLRRVGMTPNGVAATKMFAGHLSWLADQISIDEWLPERRWVHFIRRDKLGQAISAAIAEQTGVWQGPREGERKPEFSADQIDALMRYLIGAEAAWTLYFVRNRIEPLILSYEEVDLDPSASIHKLAAHLGVTLDREPDLDSPLIRQRTALNEEWRERYLAEAGDLSRFDTYSSTGPAAQKPRGFLHFLKRGLRKIRG
jgi:LPS sulfotransferase NodH